MAKYRFLPIALNDLEVAIEWYAARSATTAARFATEVERILADIESSPHRFPMWDDQHRYALLNRFPYIAFRLVSDSPLIVAVRHTSRDAISFESR
jgi:plasmid stabilization system protein ParE